MALTGNTVQSTYLDLVQLEQSGAGLPSHAGKEAALYDGSGAQILGRTAQRHWLDPHPDAIAGSWEFSTYGDANQAALETAGWTFTNCTAEAANGVLWLTTDTTNAWTHASLAVSLTGDFDFMAAPVSSDGYGDLWKTGGLIGGVGVARTGTDVSHHCYLYRTNSVIGRVATYQTGTWASGAGTGNNITGYMSNNNYSVARIFRSSGTVYMTGGAWPNCALTPVTTAASIGSYGWAYAAGGTVADANTFDKVFIAPMSAAAGVASKHGFLFLRRFD